jgi:hypothetical protein
MLKTLLILCACCEAETRPVQTPVAHVSTAPQAKKPTEVDLKALRDDCNVLLDWAVAADARLDTIERYRSAKLDPSSPGSYSKVETSVGFFLLSLEGAEPYLDGIKVKLEIGNPLALAFAGFQLSAKWGSRKPAGMAAIERWTTGLKSTSESYTQSLVPGKWNTVELILPSTKADQFGYLEISVGVDVVRMATP